MSTENNCNAAIRPSIKTDDDHTKENNYNTDIKSTTKTNDTQTNENIFDQEYIKLIIALVRDSRIALYLGIALVVFVTIFEGFSILGFNIDSAPHAILIGGVFASGAVKMFASSFNSQHVI